MEVNKEQDQSCRILLSHKEKKKKKKKKRRFPSVFPFYLQVNITIVSTGELGVLHFATGDPSS